MNKTSFVLKGVKKIIILIGLGVGFGVLGVCIFAVTVLDKKTDDVLDKFFQD